MSTNNTDELRTKTEQVIKTLLYRHDDICPVVAKEDLALVLALINEQTRLARISELEQVLVDDGWSNDSEVGRIQISGNPTHRIIADRIMRLAELHKGSDSK